MNDGNIWYTNNYPLREVSKSAIYRHEATRMAMKGLLDIIFGEEYYLYGAHFEDFHKGEPERILGYRDDAILIGTSDGSVWISHVKKKNLGIKLPATSALKHLLGDKEELSLSAFDIINGRTYREIYYI